MDKKTKRKRENVDPSSLDPAFLDALAMMVDVYGRMQIRVGQPEVRLADGDYYFPEVRVTHRPSDVILTAHGVFGGMIRSNVAGTQTWLLSHRRAYRLLEAIHDRLDKQKEASARLQEAYRAQRLGDHVTAKAIMQKLRTKPPRATKAVKIGDPVLIHDRDWMIPGVVTRVTTEGDKVEINACGFHEFVRGVVWYNGLTDQGEMRYER